MYRMMLITHVWTCLYLSRRSADPEYRSGIAQQFDHVTMMSYDLLLGVSHMTILVYKILYTIVKHSVLL